MATKNKNKIIIITRHNLIASNEEVFCPIFIRCDTPLTFAIQQRNLEIGRGLHLKDQRRLCAYGFCSLIFRAAKEKQKAKDAVKKQQKV